MKQILPILTLTTLAAAASAQSAASSGFNYNTVSLGYSNEDFSDSNIAAVIVEPVAGSTGVLIPPKGYLERLRAICDKHGILLIFDEVITGFGRLGASFAAEYFGVVPDLMTVAKGISNATVPMGGVFVRKLDRSDAMEVYDLRSGLTGLAGSLLAPLITEQQIDRWKSCLLGTDEESIRRSAAEVPSRHVGAEGIELLQTSAGDG